jgi:hypothetical protein
MRGQSGMPGNESADGMIEHDADVGKLLKALDDLGVSSNTIVVVPTSFPGPIRRNTGIKPLCWDFKLQGLT